MRTITLLILLCLPQTALAGPLVDAVKAACRGPASRAIVVRAPLASFTSTRFGSTSKPSGGASSRVPSNGFSCRLASRTSPA